MHIVVLCKRQYTNRDVIDDQFGRLWEIPAALAEQGHTVTAICLSYQRRSTGEVASIEAGAGRVRWISMNAGPFWLAGFFRYLVFVKDFIRKARPDVIWSASDTIYAILGQSLGRRNRCCVVTDLYDNFEYFGSYKLPPVRSRFRRAVRESDGISCVSQALQGHLRENYSRQQNTVVVTNAVDTGVFHPMDKTACREQLGLPVDATLVGAAGDISNYRGADTLYEAFAANAQEPTGPMLVVAGYRTPETRIPDSENVIDLGQLAPAAIPAFLNCLDLAVIYNRSSTFGDFCFPQKFFEALACKVPVVVARVGELGHLLERQPELYYADGDAEDLWTAVHRQLGNRYLADIQVPTWKDQAELLSQLLHSVCDES